MEKSKKFLAVIGVLSLFIVPLFASAQVQPQTASSCCEIKHQIDATADVGICICEPDSDGTDCSAGPGVCMSKGIDIAGGAGGCSGGGPTPHVDWGGYCTMDTVYTVTDWIFWAFLALVIIMGVVIGLQFMTAGGDPGKVEKARGMIVYLVVGIVVAVIVKVIPALTRSIVGI